jgi:hypothetical protein
MNYGFLLVVTALGAFFAVLGFIAIRFERRAAARAPRAQKPPEPPC